MRSNKTLKKLALGKILLTIGSLCMTFVFALIVFLAFLSIAAGVNSSIDDCGDETDKVELSSSSIYSANTSIDSFVREHEEAYILSWKIGGFLPSASITQTMIENGFNFTNPNGTSLWMAHNMGGVKTSKLSDFTGTIAQFGEDSVDLSGTRPGANVGDGTGGAYAWFKDYNAGIVGKAEFMKNQSLYRGAINNTDGVSTLSAIADGGWATDPTYKTKLIEQYQTLGVKFKWLDDKAIAEHGEKPATVGGTPNSVEMTRDDSDEEETVEVAVTSSLSSDWRLILVNRDNITPEMNPQLTSVEGISVDSRIAEATQELINKARDINPAFRLISGYRSVEYQKTVYDGYVRQEMAQRGISYEEAEKFTQVYSQPSGASEHQTGLAVDISTHTDLNLMSQSDSEALKKAAVELGFIRRFEAEYSASTGIGYEDWHYRYVGVEHAKKMTEGNLSLEDYLKSSSTTQRIAADGCGEGDIEMATYGTGTLPADARGGAGWTPETLPPSLLPYIIDPKNLGLEYGGRAGWVEHSGQCVDLSISLGNAIWGYSGVVIGNGWKQAEAWSLVRFQNTPKDKPVKGAIFSTGSHDPGHTGIVCHMFEDGSILIVEQNTSWSGIDEFGQKNTWNYRVFTPEQQKASSISYAYSTTKEPKFNNK